MSDFINTIDVLGDDVVTDSIIDRSITEYKDNNVSRIGKSAFTNCSQLTNVECPSASSVLDYAFQGCLSLISASFISAQTIGQKALFNCQKLESVNIPMADIISTQAFSQCYALKKVDILVWSSIGAQAFSLCQALQTLILRSETMCTLSDANALAVTPIASGTGYIYVPRALIDSYKTASNWSTYANQFRALEDYTVDGTINGELDENRGNPWGAVANAIANGTYKDVYKIGDTVPLHLGTYGEVDMEIVAFDADDKADGSGKAPITWISKDLITRHKLNSTDTNAGGWLGCELRSWMRSDLYNSIPEAIRNSIVEVNKTYADFVSTNTTETKTCVDNIWIPSDLEVTGVVSTFETSGCNYATHFNNVGLAKYIEKIYSESWWLRSSAEKNNVWMRSVTKQGGIDYAHPTGDFGVVLGFCT